MKLRVAILFLFLSLAAACSPVATDDGGIGGTGSPAE